MTTPPAPTRPLGPVQLIEDDAGLKELLPRLSSSPLVAVDTEAASFHRYVDRVYLLFPDPWPKRRHRDRRFTGRGNLDALARVMADGAELRIASDDMSFIRWTLEQARLHPDLAWQARRPEDWRRPPEDWIGTRYQEKAVKAGRNPVFLTFSRVPRRRKTA